MAFGVAALGTVTESALAQTVSPEGFTDTEFRAELGRLGVAGAEPMLLVKESNFTGLLRARAG